MERKWTDIQYNVQDNADVAHKNVIMFCNTNQISALTFCGPSFKPHGASRLSKHYNLCFDPKLDNDVCAIFRIPCNYVSCTSMLDKPWISGITSYKQEHYKPVTNFNYWLVLGPFDN